jgi:uncharacterized iron-regulated membrane protein
VEEDHRAGRIDRRLSRFFAPMERTMATIEPAPRLALPVRRLLSWIHLWVGVAFCLPFALLGITGSILVYQQPISNFVTAAPRATAIGQMQSPQAIIDAGTKGREGMVATLLSMPQAAGDPAILRLVRGRALYQALIDPVSLQVLDLSPFTRFYWMGLVHDFHSSLLVGERKGRPLVGWLGVGMLALGLSGIVLWWPRQGNWRGAYGIRKGARGWLFHRQLHGTVGITAWVLFIVLSFSGVAISFPQTTTALLRTALFQRPITNARIIRPAAQGGARVVPVDGAERIDADKALAAATAAAPNTHLATMFLPNGPRQPFLLFLRPAGAAQGSPGLAVTVDPYRAEVIRMNDPWAGDLGRQIMTWQGPLHSGRGINAVYRLLIFTVGLLPALFAVTGVAMWWTKRRARARVVSGDDAGPRSVAAE